MQNVDKHPRLDPSGPLLQVDQQDPGEHKVTIRHCIITVYCAAYHQILLDTCTHFLPLFSSGALHTRKSIRTLERQTAPDVADDSGRLFVCTGVNKSVLPLGPVDLDTLAGLERQVFPEKTKQSIFYAKRSICSILELYVVTCVSFGKACVFAATDLLPRSTRWAGISLRTQLAFEALGSIFSANSRRSVVARISLSSHLPFGAGETILALTTECVLGGSQDKRTGSPVPHTR